MSLTKIRSVDPDSPARRAGVRSGETLTEVNGHPIVDVLDYKFHTYDPRLILKLPWRNTCCTGACARARRGPCRPH